MSGNTNPIILIINQIIISTFLECDNLQSDKLTPSFRKKLLPPSTRLNGVTSQNSVIWFQNQNNHKYHAVHKLPSVSAFYTAQRTKGKAVPADALKAPRKSRDITPLILNIAITWRYVATLRPRPLYFRQLTLVRTE